MVPRKRAWWGSRTYSLFKSWPALISTLYPCQVVDRLENIRSRAAGQKGQTTRDKPWNESKNYNLASPCSLNLWPEPAFAFAKLGLIWKLARTSEWGHSNTVGGKFCAIPCPCNQHTPSFQYHNMSTLQQSLPLLYYSIRFLQQSFHIHSWYYSLQPKSAVVYFFQAGAPFSIDILTRFDHFWLFRHDFTYFLVPLVQA